MDSRHFDDLTKALATSTTRRQALQRIGGTLAGSLLAAWPFTQALAAGGGNSQCAHFCAQVFGANTSAAEQCTSDAAHGTGLCYSCGPAAPATHPPLCGQVCCGNGQSCCSGTCTDLNTTSNCGSCGNACTTSVANATAVCTSGVCGFVCNSGYQSCNGTCINTTSDPNNCGQCGHVCASGETCVSGACTCGSHGDCLAGQNCCGGMCVNEKTDAQNCGACGHVCSSGQVCNNGTCGGVPTCTFVCPPQDLAGRPLLAHSSTDTVLSCQYLMSNGSCTYFVDTGLLKQDNDSGFCAPVAVPFCTT